MTPLATLRAAPVRASAGSARRVAARTLSPARVEQAYTELAKKRDDMEKRRLRTLLKVATFFDEVAREEIAAMRGGAAAGDSRDTKGVDHGEIVVEFGAADQDP